MKVTAAVILGQIQGTRRSKKALSVLAIAVTSVTLQRLQKGSKSNPQTRLNAEALPPFPSKTSHNGRTGPCLLCVAVTSEPRTHPNGVAWREVTDTHV
jgi:hypothetical protein